MRVFLGVSSYFISLIMRKSVRVFLGVSSY